MRHGQGSSEWQDDADTKTRRRTSRQVLRDADASSAATLTGRSTVLIAEDDGDMRALLAVDLRTSGYDVVEVKNGRDLLRAIETGVVAGDRVQPDLIVSDIRMPGSTGLEVLRALRTSDWAMPVILITAFGDPETHEEARRLGAATVLDKPFDLQTLRHAVSDIVPPTI